MHISLIRDYPVLFGVSDWLSGWLVGSCVSYELVTSPGCISDFPYVLKTYAWIG